MFTKDTRTETFLTQMGVDVQYTNKATIAGLVKDWRTTNLSRPVPLREEAVYEYAALMEGGSPAPAPILHATKKGDEVLDGMQRIAAIELLGATSFSAYMVTCDSDDMLAAISLLANTRLQGRAESPEWTRRRTVEVLVIERKLSVDEVSRMGGWRKADIQALARILEWGVAIQSIGGPDLPDTMIDVVSQHVSKSDLRAVSKPAAEFLKTLKDAKFSASDAESYVEDFFRPSAKTSKRFKALADRLEMFKEDPEVQIRLLGRKSAGLTRDVHLRRALKTVVTVLEEIKKSGEKLLYIDEYFKLAGQIHNKLHDLSPSHKKPRK